MKLFKKFLSGSLALVILLMLSSGVTLADRTEKVYFEQEDSTTVRPILYDSSNRYNVHITGDLDVDGTLTVASVSMTGDLDMDGYDITLDTDGDTGITGDRDAGVADDEIGFTVAGALDFLIQANKFKVLAGSTFHAQTDSTAAFLIQNAAGTTLASYDTTNLKMTYNAKAGNSTLMSFNGIGNDGYKLFFQENSANAFSIFYDGSGGGGVLNRMFIRSEISGQQRNIVGFTPAGNFQILNGLALKQKVVDNTNYTVTIQDHFVVVRNLTAARTISLPAASTVVDALDLTTLVKVFTVKDESGLAATHNITIDPNGSETIDGQLTAKITSNYGAIDFYTNGVAWFIK